MGLPPSPPPAEGEGGSGGAGCGGSQKPRCATHPTTRLKRGDVTFNIPLRLRGRGTKGEGCGGYLSPPPSSLSSPLSPSTLSPTLSPSYPHFRPHFLLNSACGSGAESPPDPHQRQPTPYRSPPSPRRRPRRARMDGRGGERSAQGTPHGWARSVAERTRHAAW